jgi:PST family polysaccharide transporter
VSLGRLTETLRHPISQNVLSLYLVQIGMFLVPVATLPYTSRVLGPDGFGLVVFAQGFSFLLGLVIQWGFSASGTRAAAVARDDPDALSRTLAAVLGGQLLLTAAAGVIAAVALVTIPLLRAHPELAVLAWIAAAANGLAPDWFLLGVERLRLAAVTQLAVRVASAGALFVLVHHHGDAWIVMALYAGSSLVAGAVAMVIAYRHAQRRMPRLRESVRTVREAWALFVAAAALTLYTSMNVVLLGLFAPPAEVARYGAAERLVRTALQIMGPMGAAVYPRLVYLNSTRRTDRARRLLLMAVAVVGGIAGAAALALAVFAPWIVRVIFGSAFGATVPVLRLMALIIPANIVASACGAWMFSLHRDRTVVRIVLGIGLLNVGLACVLAPARGAIGMGMSVLTAEVVGAVACAVAVRHGDDVGSRARRLIITAIRADQPD